jgi:cytochrome c553
MAVAFRLLKHCCFINPRRGSIMNRMLSLISGALAAGAVLLAGTLVAQNAVAGIANTKHNLTATGSANQFSGTAEICVFCHTPHGSDTSAAVPLWNRKLSTPASYTTYDSLGTSTLDGSTAPVGSVSIACLSCHDGTQAMNVMLNQPGSGGYNAAGAAMAGTWTGPAATATPVGSLNYATASIVNLGVDLRNDHPIGIQYGGGGIASGTQAGASAGTTKDPDFVAPNDDLLGGTRIWWVDTGGAGRQKTDMLLYTRNEASVAGGYQPFVECASCHAPHTENPASRGPPKAGSAVSLACHNK